MTVIVLALASAASFGAMTVAIRSGLAHGGDASASALSTILTALALTLAASLVRHDYAGAWRFWLAGLLAPGISQLLFTYAVQEVGASRTSVTAGVAPLFAIVIAFTLLDEPVRTLLVLGGIAIVGGGIVLAAERNRPGHLRARGLLLAIGAALMFAVRDNIVRALHAQGSPETAAAATLLAGALVALVATRRTPTRVELRRFAPAGLFFGCSYLLLFEAYFHGRVSVVSPLVATESLWGVGLSVLLFRGAEGVGRRLALGTLLVVCGGVLIGLGR